MVAGALMWHQWPRPPSLEGERWFKVLLATALRGEVEQAGGDVSDWEARVARWVWYHPAGRLPELKVKNPVVARLPGAALPGEVALLEALAALEAPSARWARLYDRDETAREAVLVDPEDLGEAYDPGTTLGPGASWDTLADWGGQPDEAQGAFVDAAMRSLDARWVLIEGRPGKLGGPSVLPALQRLLPASRVTRMPWTERSALTDHVQALEQGLAPLAEPGVRLVLVAEEAGMAVALRVLAQHLAIRDQVVAVVGIGGVIGGRDDEAEGPLSRKAAEDWLGQHFRQSALESEVVRLTPFFAVQWLDREAWPPGVSGLALEDQRFPEPDDKDSTATTLEVVDLGPLPASPELPVAQVARALIAVVASWVVTRR